MEEFSFDSGLWVRRSWPWGQAGIAGLFRIVSCVSRIALVEPRWAGACFFTLAKIGVRVLKNRWLSLVFRKKWTTFGQKDTGNLQKLACGGEKNTGARIQKPEDNLSGSWVESSLSREEADGGIGGEYFSYFNIGYFG